MRCDLRQEFLGDKKPESMEIGYSSVVDGEGGVQGETNKNQQTMLI
jgi:hypothetical protein